MKEYFPVYDTILYLSNGEIDSVKTYSAGGSLEGTKEYTYTSGRITSVKETGTRSSLPFTRTFTYTYNGSGQLTDMVVTYQVGTFEDGELESITGITYTNGNITSGNVDIYMTGFNPPAMPATVEYETTAPNPYKGLNTNPDEILEMFSANNATKAYADADPTNPFFEYAYTYQDGRVKTISYGEIGDYSVTNTLTYQCK